MTTNYFKNYPNKEGFFEDYGGSFIPPQLQAEMEKIDGCLLFDQQIAPVYFRTAQHPQTLPGKTNPSLLLQPVIDQIRRSHLSKTGRS